MTHQKIVKLSCISFRRKYYIDVKLMLPCFQDHYPAVDREKVKVVMTHMVQAGRLQPVPNCPGLVRMCGVVRQLVDQEALPVHLHGDALTHDDDMQEAVIDEKASPDVNQAMQ